jgi:hypothetical protein
VCVCVCIILYARATENKSVSMWATMNSINCSLEFTGGGEFNASSGGGDELGERCLQEHTT